MTLQRDHAAVLLSFSKAVTRDSCMLAKHITIAPVFLAHTQGLDHGPSASW